jgi:5'(3')-deoxyribonucleotidase
MDEVLTDFVGGCLKAHGMSRIEFNSRHKLGEWDMSAALGIEFPGRIWEPIDKLGEAFWTGLEPLPWISELLKLVEKDDWWIVSSPSSSPLREARLQSHTGKMRWLYDYFGNDFNRFVPTPHKFLLANFRSVLIDDREANLDTFREHGGCGIVFPTRHNSLYRFESQPLTHVEKQLRIFRNVML